MAADEQSTMLELELITAERNTALRVAFTQLPPHCRRLLSMLMQDPPLSYAEISERLEMPMGGIGPNRARCLDRLRKSPELTALGDFEGKRGR
jgi:DNA-directed RNA polymerase specialized sigma24 family protein